MSKHTLVIDTLATVNAVSSLLQPSATNGDRNFRNWKRLMDRVTLGMFQGGPGCLISVGAVAAAATLTFTGAPTAAQSFILNGVTFTARASGAVANEFNIGGSVAATAANAAAAVNASVTANVAGVVSAMGSAAGVVTFSAVQPGLAGNMFTLTETLSNATATAFAGGAVSSTTTFAV